jgi:hypothetical protein
MCLKTQFAITLIVDVTLRGHDYLFALVEEVKRVVAETERAQYAINMVQVMDRESEKLYLLIKQILRVYLKAFGFETE